ncbi:MAG: DUF1800 family protein [Planctomycetota bacterium]
MSRGLFLLLLLLAAGSARAQGDSDPAAERRRVVHALSRLSFGATRELVDAVLAKGYEAWLDEQLTGGEPDPDTARRLEAFPTLGLTSAEIYRDYVNAPTAAPDRAARNAHAREDLVDGLLVRAVYSERQVGEVMADFWRNHFNVDRAKDSVAYTATEWDRDVIRRHVFGRFPELLLETARHPAMLVYLDNHLSRRPPSKTELKAVARDVRRKTGSKERGEEAARIAEQRGLNENYARELLELHTLGVDRGYTQKDVIAVAEAFTGWSVDSAESRWVFDYRDDYHVHGDKFILGRSVPRQKRRLGHVEGEVIIERLGLHRDTSIFLAEKLCRYLVADQPPRSIVESTAAKLRATDFDLAAVVRHVATSDEFFAPEAFRGKFKTPLEFVVSALRVTEAEITDPAGLRTIVAEMGQPIYNCEDPTGYRDVAESWRDPGVMVARWRFALDLVEGRIKGVTVPERVLASVKDKNRFLMIRDLGERVLPGGMRQETLAFCNRAGARWDKARREADEEAPPRRREGEGQAEAQGEAPRAAASRGLPPRRVDRIPRIPGAMTMSRSPLDPRRLDRRRFLALGAAAAAWPRLGAGAPRLCLGPNGKRCVVAVYLRGGADALNIVVPHADPLYAQLRPGIGIAAEATDDEPGVVKLDERFGLHPALSGLEPLWKAKRLAPIVCTGSPHPTRSHFDAQDFMEYAAPGSRTVKDGWLNRYLQLRTVAAEGSAQKADQALRGLAVKKVLPRALRGDFPALAVDGRRKKDVDEVLDVFDPLYGGGDTMSEIESMTERDEPGEGAVQVGRDTIATLRRLDAILEDPAATTRKGVKYPRGGFGSGLETIARVVKAKAGLEAACLDIGGWDTHSQQGGARGNMANRLRELGDGLAAFAADLGPQFEDVVVVVMTEFGRTCLENGTFGTDHGHGSATLVLGGGVAGGKVRGDWPGLDPKKLYQGRDLQVTTDFREIFRDVLENHLGAKLPKDFFPDYELARKGLGLFA